VPPGPFFEGRDLWLAYEIMNLEEYVEETSQVPRRHKPIDI